MHTVELMEQAIEVAERLGYGVRHEWLGGCGGGACEIGGRKWIFLDISLTTSEQLDQVTLALQSDPGIYHVALSHELAQFMSIRKTA